MGEEEYIQERPDKINYYLDIAEAVCRRSTCLKRHYGAIIVKNDEIISTGYNGAPRGMYSCLDTGICRRKNSPRGTDYSECCSVHAEQNAIISACRRDMIGADIYIVGLEQLHNVTELYVSNPSPCSLCKRMIINAGINMVYLRTDAGDYKMISTKSWREDDIVGGY